MNKFLVLFYRVVHSPRILRLFVRNPDILHPDLFSVISRRGPWQKKIQGVDSTNKFIPKSTGDPLLIVIPYLK